MSLLGDAQDQLDKIARLADADASQIKEARAAYEAARESLAPSAALFDILGGIAAGHATAETAKRRRAGELDRRGSRDTNCRIQRRARVAVEALKATPPFHFPIAFPQVFLRGRAGFDVILGNPPWEEVRQLEEDRFWTTICTRVYIRMPQYEQEEL